MQSYRGIAQGFRAVVPRLWLDGRLLVGRRGEDRLRSGAGTGGDAKSELHTPVVHGKPGTVWREDSLSGRCPPGMLFILAG